MSSDGVAVPTTSSIDDQEQLENVLVGVLEIAENILASERNQKHDENSGDVDLSPLLDLADDDSLASNDLASAISSLDPESGWEHDGWEPGEPCPECGANHISVIEPREYYYYYDYDERGDILQSSYGDVSGPAINHYCKECDTLLSEHPATSLFWIE